MNQSSKTMDQYIAKLGILSPIKRHLSSLAGATPEMWEALATKYEEIDAPANAQDCRDRAEALRRQVVG